jgi:hypothetical protein
MLPSFLGVFRKSAKNDCCPSVRVKQLGSHWTDFDETWYLTFFYIKSVDKIQVSLKSDKNNGYFTWRRFHICDNISLNSFQKQKCFRQSCRENQCSITFFFLSKIVSFVRWRRKMWWSQRGHKWRHNMTHTCCMLDKQGCTHARAHTQTTV